MASLAEMRVDEAEPMENESQARPEELRLLEALLFASNEPLDTATLAKRMPEGVDHVADSECRRQSLLYFAREVQQVSQVIQAMVKESGFDMKIQQVEFATSLQAAQKGDFEAYLIGWSGRVDPDGNLTAFIACDGNSRGSPR